MMIETHCHLDYLKAEPLEEIRKKIKETGIIKVVTIGVDPVNIDLVMELSHSCEEIYFTQGIHPHDSKEATDVEFQKIIARSIMPKMVAVGEIGLPVVIHTREAEEDTKAILKNFSQILKSKGVIHSFTSTIDLAEFVLSEGFYIGFNGIITFKKAENVQEVVKMTPIDRILFETDAPFLTPVPHRGKENAPFYLPFIASKVAELKNLNLEELKKQVLTNSLNCFPKLK